MDWQKLLSAIAPVAVGIGAGVSGHPQQGASFIEGFRGSDQLMWQRRIQEEEAARRQAALEAETANRQADNVRQDHQARLQRLSMALQQMGPQVQQQTETATDPMAAQQALGDTSQQLESTFELQPGAMRPFVPQAQALQPMMSQAKIRRAKAAYAEFQKMTGDQASEVEQTFSWHQGEWAGMTAAQVREIADLPAPSKKTATPRQDPAAGSFEDYVGRYAKDIGKTVETLTAGDIEAARKKYGQSDDRVTGSPRERYQVQQVTNADGTTGLIRVNLDTGGTERIPLPSDVAGAGRPTAGEQNASLYLPRLDASNDTTSKFESKLSSLGRQFDVQMPNLLRSPEGQLYRQAQDEFINASLRRESGAAIQPSEYDRYGRIYFVQPGDTRETIAQKQGARRRVIEGFRTGAGNLRGSGGAPEAPSSAKNAAKIGERRLINGVLAEWDGKGWKAVQ